MKLYRVILPAGDLGRSVDYFSRVLDTPGERVSGERHYFDCGGVILACVVPESAGQARPNSDHLYFAVSDLEATYSRAEEAAAKGLGARLSASEVSAAAKLVTAIPAKISVKELPVRLASA